ncbi:phage baseplate assembly protein V [Pseudomonas arsenicoxydans]|uniref:Phage baseplate assembly protein V n=1 Tax=Pseudomonas arsenicoxydans TaxID=702115 RepID=A0A502HS45_9PSED|nr:phage baseplate assembly protein V [Pseudomonas arsenicoxydans]
MGDMDSLTELTRRLENLIRAGTIAELDPEKPRCRVKTGGLLTDWLPFFALRAGEDSDWDPPSVDEQCLVLSPSGNPAHGFVIFGVYSDRFPAPDNEPTRRRRRYRDGALVDYDTATHTLTATLPEGGKVELIVPSGLKIKGDVDIDGLVNVTKDVVAGEQKISLVNHRTSGVMRGNALSDGPVP